MKKITLLFVLLLSGSFLFAQSDEKSGSNYNDYNHWSIELQAGMTKPLRPMKSGYSTRTPEFWQGDIGVRYMINENFGFKVDFGYNFFENHGHANDFKSELMRTSLQGVVNLGSVLGFRDWTNRLNLLAHGGVGYGRLTPKEPAKLSTDQLAFGVIGLTPQLRLGNHFALTADASVYGNVRQNYTFDGTGTTSTRGFNGMFVNTSIGLTYYMGGQEKHADWHIRKEQDYTNELEDMANRMEALEKDNREHKEKLNEYLEDKDGNGIPDILEQAMDRRLADAESKGSSSDQDFIKKLINDGYVNVYFRFDSAEPETYSLQAVNYLILYMKENPSVNAELIGYADEIGNAEYNKTLSERRANLVKELMIASGIDAGRLETVGNGSDSSVDKSSKNARQLVRRVTFKIK